MRSLTNRLALLIFGITLIVIAGVYLGVTSGLDAGVRAQRLQELTRVAREYQRPIWEALNGSLDRRVLDRRVRKAGDDSGTRVTLLGVNRGTQGPQTYLASDSTAESKITDLRSAIAHHRSVDVGLSTQDWGEWLADVGKAAGIGAIFAGAGGAAAVALMRRLPRGWWAPGTAVVLAFAAATLYLGPVVLDPIFNRFTRLPEGQTRRDVLALAREAGVDVGEVYEVDASRRTTGSNAYVTGLGRTKRVVLYDNLLEDFSRDEVRLVVAHELGHVHYRDVPRGLLFVVLVAPIGMFAAAQMTRRLAPEPGPAALPALALSIAVVSLGVSTISNQLSRRIEARADSYSLRLTDAPEPFIGFEQGIAVRNVSDPDPPDWLTWLLASHPPTVERIGIAKSFEAGRR